MGPPITAGLFALCAVAILASMAYRRRRRAIVTIHPTHGDVTVTRPLRFRRCETVVLQRPDVRHADVIQDTSSRRARSIVVLLRTDGETVPVIASDGDVAYATELAARINAGVDARG